MSKSTLISRPAPAFIAHDSMCHQNALREWGQKSASHIWWYYFSDTVLFFIPFTLWHSNKHLATSSTDKGKSWLKSYFQFTLSQYYCSGWYHLAMLSVFSLPTVTKIFEDSVGVHQSVILGARTLESSVDLWIFLEMWICHLQSNWKHKTKQTLCSWDLVTCALKSPSGDSSLWTTHLGRPTESHEPGI